MPRDLLEEKIEPHRDLLGEVTNPPPQDILRKSPPKWVPWARAGMEMAGLTGGAILGGLAGGYGAIPGAGLGYAAGKELGKLVLPRESPYPELKLSPLEKASEVSTDVLSGMAMEATGQVATKVLPKILPFYAKGRTPGAEEVSILAEREGVRIPASDITGSTGQASLASTVQKLPQTASTMQKEAETATGQFANYVERTLGKTGGKVEPFIAGEAAQEGKLLKVAENKIAGTKLYNRAKDVAKGVDVEYSSINKAMTDVQESDAYQLLSDNSRKEVDKVISFLEGKMRPDVSARMKGSMKLPPDVEAKVLAQAGQETTPTTYMEAEGIRKSIADKLFSKNIKGTEAQGPIRKIYDALQQDMEASAQKAGSEAHGAFVKARDFWGKNVFGEGMETGLIGKLGPTFEGGVSPEKAVTLLKNASLTDIAKVKQGMPPENFLTFRQGLLTQIFQQNSKVSPTSNELIYNGPQLAKDLFGKGGLGEAKLKALMTPEEFTFLKELATVGERMGSSWKIAGNPSGTAHTLYNLHLMGQIGKYGGYALAGGAGEYARRKEGLGTGLAVAGAFLTPYVLAKFITSNIGRQYLMQGFPRLERGFGRALPPGIIGTKGILTKSEPNTEIPIKGLNKKEETK